MLYNFHKLFFIITVGFTSAVTSLGVYFGFRYLTGDSTYAQLGVTYTLSLTGILMVLFAALKGMKHE